MITLREVDGLDYEEISQALGIPRGTVMSRLFYARKMLQRALKEIAPDTASRDEQEQSSADTGSDDEGDDKRLRRAPG